MTIAEKLQQIAINTQKVFDAGRNSAASVVALNQIEFIKAFHGTDELYSYQEGNNGETTLYATVYSNYAEKFVAIPCTVSIKLDTTALAPVLLVNKDWSRTLEKDIKFLVSINGSAQVYMQTNINADHGYNDPVYEYVVVTVKYNDTISLSDLLYSAQDFVENFYGYADEYMPRVTTDHSFTWVVPEGTKADQSPSVYISAFQYPDWSYADVFSGEAGISNNSWTSQVTQ